MSPKRKKTRKRSRPAQRSTTTPTIRESLAAGGLAPSGLQSRATPEQHLPAPPAPAGALDAFIQRHGSEVVGVTFSFEPPPQPPLQTVHLRVTGQRLDVEGRRGPADTFVRDETLEHVPGGAGPVAMTVKVRDVTPGMWTVRGEARTIGASESRTSRPLPVRQAGWSWRRWRLTSAPAEPIRTRMAPLVPAPAVLLGSWLAFVVFGIVLALIAQSLVLATQSVRVGHVLTISLVGVLFGAVGAKVWYMVLHRRERRRDGWAIQGLIAGFAVAAPVLLWSFDVPAGVYLDGTTPGLLLGMATGRVGCFLTGCCAGRPTRSRWALFSSNRHVATRRVPAQLLESSLALAIGAATLVAVLTVGPRNGTIFVAALATYTLVRQRLLLLREEKRRSYRGPQAIAAVSIVVLLVASAAAVWA